MVDPAGRVMVPLHRATWSPLTPGYGLPASKLMFGRLDAAHASVLSRTELESGMRSGERASVARLFSALAMEPVTDAIAGRSAEHLRKFRRSHSNIDIVDYVIAATAEHLGAKLITFNVRHFPMFPDLQPPFPP